MIIINKDILTFLLIEYRDAWTITLYFDILGFSIPKIRLIGLLYHIKNLSLKKLKTNMFKWTYGHSSENYNVAFHSQSYLITTDQSLESIGKL